MTFEEKLKEARKEGREEILQMFRFLKEQGRSDDLDRALSDAEFRRKIFEEMGL